MTNRKTILNDWFRNIRVFYLPKFQDIVRLKFWKSWTFLNFRTIYAYIDMHFVCLWCTYEVKMSCYKIWPAKTLNRSGLGHKHSWHQAVMPQKCLTKQHNGLSYSFSSVMSSKLGRWAYLQHSVGFHLISKSCGYVAAVCSVKGRVAVALKIATVSLTATVIIKHLISTLGAAQTPKLS